MHTKSIELSKIRCDSGTQSRVWINDDAVADYAERMADGDKFPPIVVFFDGTEYHLADGFHRVMAASRNKAPEIIAEIHKGTVTDAVWYSIGANKVNGVKRTSGDKRKSIEIALSKFPEKTQEAIAEQVGCSQRYVGMLQDELRSSSKLTVPVKRIGKDGKSRPTKYKQPEPTEEPQDEPAEELPVDEEPATTPRNVQAFDGGVNYFAKLLAGLGEEITQDGTPEQCAECLPVLDHLRKALKAKANQ